MASRHSIPPEQRPEGFQTEDTFGETQHGKVIWARWGYQGYEPPDPSRGVTERQPYRDRAGNLVLVGRLRLEMPDGRIRDLLYSLGKGWALASGKAYENLWEEEVASVRPPRPDGRPHKFARQAKYGKLLDACFDMGLDISVRGSASRISIFEGLVFDMEREEYGGGGIEGAVEVPTGFYPEDSTPPFSFEGKMYGPAPAPRTPAPPSPVASSPAASPAVAGAARVAPAASPAVSWRPGEKELVDIMVAKGLLANDFEGQVAALSSLRQTMPISNDIAGEVVNQAFIPRLQSEGKISVDGSGLVVAVAGTGA